MIKSICSANSQHNCEHVDIAKNNPFIFSVARNDGTNGQLDPVGILWLQTAVDFDKTITFLVWDLAVLLRTSQGASILPPELRNPPLSHLSPRPQSASLNSLCLEIKGVHSMYIGCGYKESRQSPSPTSARVRGPLVSEANAVHTWRRATCHAVHCQIVFDIFRLHDLKKINQITLHKIAYNVYIPMHAAQHIPYHTNMQ